MSRRLWKYRITDILEFINKIHIYVADMEFDDFEKDEKTIDAIIRNLIVIGEAARNVPIDKQRPSALLYLIKASRYPDPSVKQPP